MDALAALADPTRRRVIELLADGPRPAGGLAAEFAMSQPAVSRHLRVLREAGLVRVEAAGQQRIYHLVTDPLAELDAWLTPYRGFWQQRLDALDTELARGKRPRASRSAPTNEEAM